MNRYILSILALFLSLQLMGQMFPLSDHYIFNALSINPAVAGSQDALNTTLSYRNQWAGFKDAPKSLMLSVHTPLDNDRVGLGLLIDNNSIGIYKETGFMGNYAFRRELFNGRFALGLGMGITIYHMAWNELDATDEDDAELMNNPATAVLPAFSLGSYYYTKKYFIGFSIPEFLSHELDQSTGKYRIKNNFAEYNYFLTGGYQAVLSPRIKLLPSLLIKYHPNHAIQVDYNVLVILNNKIWIGTGYRNTDMLVWMFRCQVNKQLNIAYSYDFVMGNTGYKNGSHEMVLNYVFSFEGRVTGPRQF